MLRQIMCMAVVLTCGAALVACEDDDDTGGRTDAGQADAGGMDASMADAGKMDAGEAGDAGDAGDGGGAADGGEGGMPTLAQRGQYLVEEVAKCGDCHSPMDAMGKPISGKEYSGVTCFIDAAPMDPATGCLSSANLTNDNTGLKDRSDKEIKDMLLKGLRPNGDALHPLMPYWAFANMSDTDADAIVTFLRSVPAVTNTLPTNQAPFLVEQPADPVDLDKVPKPEASDPNYDSAMRGRYIAANIGICLECHTEESGNNKTPRNLAKVFQGGREFPAAALGLPVPPFPATIVSANLTPDETGLKDWSVDDITKALRMNLDEEGMKLCPPMPHFSGMTLKDATDVAHYLKSLPAKVNVIPECDYPVLGDGGVSDGGAGDAG